jgi:hypothetical protein
MIIFSFDIDWAPEKAIEDVIQHLNAHHIAATFFATHNSAVLKQVEKSGFHEIGVHPNFNPLLNGQGGNYQNVIDDLLNLYPTAVGIRSHSLAHSCPMLIYCLEKNFKYDSNIYIPFAKNIKAFDYFGITRIPYNWEDDGQWVAGKTFDHCGLDLDAELNIFSFHPIHIYLNTPDQAFYERFKQYYQIPEELLKNRNTEIPGTRDLFLALLDHCQKNNVHTSTLKQYNNFLRQNPESLMNEPQKYIH